MASKIISSGPEISMAKPLDDSTNRRSSRGGDGAPGPSVQRAAKLAKQMQLSIGRFCLIFGTRLLFLTFTTVFCNAICVLKILCDVPLCLLSPASVHPSPQTSQGPGRPHGFPTSRACYVRGRSTPARICRCAPSWSAPGSRAAQAAVSVELSPSSSGRCS